MFEELAFLYCLQVEREALATVERRIKERQLGLAFLDLPERANGEASAEQHECQEA